MGSSTAGGLSVVQLKAAIANNPFLRSLSQESRSRLKAYIDEVESAHRQRDQALETQITNYKQTINNARSVTDIAPIDDLKTPAPAIHAAFEARLEAAKQKLLESFFIV